MLLTLSLDNHEASIEIIQNEVGEERSDECTENPYEGHDENTEFVFEELGDDDCF